ncbi:hypothetical protein [Halomonas smyrnensis]|uniref:hypothetical protein n=1 Tax=Halomonas smyrnensis TaxID=720605 RepID=UPI0012EA94F2|nr:hypothetical protein [Halomonas smyrnensis]
MDEDLKRKLEEISKINNRIHERIPRWSEDFTRRMNEIHETLRPFGETARLATENLNPIADAVAPLFERLQEIISVIPDDIEELQGNHKTRFELLSHNGWFADFEAPLGQLFQQTKRYQELCETEGKKNADLYLTQHFEDVMREFSNSNPNEIPSSRMSIISEAIDAHEQGKYSLSAPIFLMQADGYSKDKHGYPIWGQRESLFSVAKNRNDNGMYLSALLQPMLSTKNPIVVSTRHNQDIDIPEHIINRHLVLHGESTTYGTRENSARAFSFMWYCMFFMNSFFHDQESYE